MKISYSEHNEKDDATIMKNPINYIS